VSVIVPHRNRKERLPRLLESVQRQSLKGIEVIVVDDASEESCRDVTDAFAGRGLSVRLLESEKRLYTKDARLAGVREAAAECFLFADDDDTLWGETALETHVALWRESGADMVHFRCLLTDGEGHFAASFPWADPFAPRLEGKEIFGAYARSQPDGGVIWNKIFSRALWMRLLPELRDFPIRDCCEDIFCNAVLFFHARRYVGSQVAGYGYWYREERKQEKAVEHAVALFSLLETLLPSFAARGGEPEALRDLERGMNNFLGVLVGRAGIQASRREKTGSASGFARDLLARFDNETLVRTLLAGAGVNGWKLLRMFAAVTGRGDVLPPADDGEPAAREERS
jgi:hypothetical protein